MTSGIDEPVWIAEYDPRWPGWYAEDALELSRALGTRLRDIQHFGSTAVSEMAAKPIIDILVAPVEWPLTPPDRTILERLGYEYLGTANVAGREYFRRRGGHDTNVAVVEWGSSLWCDNLLFRDFLQAHREAAAAYARSKKDAWQSGPQTLVAYSARKAHVITLLMNAAREWRAR